MGHTVKQLVATMHNVVQCRAAVQPTICAITEQIRTSHKAAVWGGHHMQDMLSYPMHHTSYVICFTEKQWKCEHFYILWNNPDALDSILKLDMYEVKRTVGHPNLITCFCKSQNTSYHHPRSVGHSYKKKLTGQFLLLTGQLFLGRV